MQIIVLGVKINAIIRLVVLGVKINALIRLNGPYEVYQA